MTTENKGVDLDAPFTVWILPEATEKREPCKFTDIVDVLKLPTGEVKVSTAEGRVESRYGEVIRMRKAGLSE